MAIFYYKEISVDTKLAIWKIEESEDYFLQFVSKQYPISHPQKRLQHLAGRFLLQYLYPEFPIHSIKLAASGKPIIEDNSYHFSISHTGGFAAAIVSKSKPVGIDIEQKRAAVVKVIHRFLHQDEIQQIKFYSNTVNTHQSTQNSSIEEADLFASNIESLILLWSAKEAIYKWWGKGNVEFNEMIRIDSWQQQSEGKMNARFLSDNSIIHLIPNFHFFDDLFLVWL